MDFLPEELSAYANEYTTPEDVVLQQLNRDTHTKVLRPRMLSGHLQGRLLSFISRMINPDRILEVGTYTGYSAICLAEGLAKGGRLHTIDHNPELEDFALSYFKRAGYEDRIVQHTGEALDVIPAMEGPFDLIFLDADKTNYVRYFDMIFPKMREGAVLLADNVLWSGKVLDAYDDVDEETQGIMRFNKHMKDHPGIRHLLLPVRDGMMVVEKTADL